MEPTPAARELRETRGLMYGVFAATEIMGLTAVVLVIYWGAKELGGFAWDGSSMQFNWHPVLMVIAFAFLMGNSIVIFRVLYFVDKMAMKIVHTLLHMTSLVLIIVALYAVINNHNVGGTPNMYSLHSWIGITTCALFFIQLCVGFGAFLIPGFPQYLKERIMPIHRFLGTTIFLMAILSMISGITEKLLFTSTSEYGQLPSWAWVGNFLGCAIVLYGIGIGILLANPSFNREEHIAYMRQQNNLNND